MEGSGCAGTGDRAIAAIPWGGLDFVKDYSIARSQFFFIKLCFSYVFSILSQSKI
jgi:hypothetical protein